MGPNWPPLQILAPGDPGTEAECPYDGEPLAGRVIATENRRPPTWTESGRVLMGQVTAGETLEVHLECSRGHRFRCPDIDDWL